MYDMLEALKEKKGREIAEKAYSFVLREKDCGKMFTERFSMVPSDREKLMSVDDKDYEAMLGYVLSALE